MRDQNGVDAIERICRKDGLTICSEDSAGVVMWIDPDDCRDLIRAAKSEHKGLHDFIREILKAYLSGMDDHADDVATGPENCRTEFDELHGKVDALQEDVNEVFLDQHDLRQELEELRDEIQFIRHGLRGRH